MSPATPLLRDACALYRGHGFAEAKPPRYGSGTALIVHRVRGRHQTKGIRHPCLIGVIGHRARLGSGSHFGFVPKYDPTPRTPGDLSTDHVARAMASHRSSAAAPPSPRRITDASMPSHGNTRIHARRANLPGGILPPVSVLGCTSLDRPNMRGDGEKKYWPRNMSPLTEPLRTTVLGCTSLNITNIRGDGEIKYWQSNMSPLTGPRSMNWTPIHLAHYFLAMDHAPSPPADIIEVSPRSPRWPEVRQDHLSRHPVCEACHTQIRREVHHVVPFWAAPELELEKTNLITLCRAHHFALGHDPDGAGPATPSWREINANCRADVAAYRQWLDETYTGYWDL